MAQTNGLLNRLMEIDDRDITWKLFQAQILLTEERYNEARWMIEKYEDQVYAHREDNPEQWCYYLYLTTLYSREDSYVDEVAEIVADSYVLTGVTGGLHGCLCICRKNISGIPDGNGTYWKSCPAIIVRRRLSILKHGICCA